MTYRGCSLAAMQSPGLTLVNYIIYYTWVYSQADSAHFTVMLCKAAFFFFFSSLFFSFSFFVGAEKQTFRARFCGVAWRSHDTANRTEERCTFVLSRSLANSGSSGCLFHKFRCRWTGTACRKFISNSHFTHTRTCKHTRARIHTHTHAHTHIYTRTHTHTRASKQKSTHRLGYPPSYPHTLVRAHTNTGPNRGSCCALTLTVRTSRAL